MKPSWPRTHARPRPRAHLPSLLILCGVMVVSGCGEETPEAPEAQPKRAELAAAPDAEPEIVFEAQAAIVEIEPPSEEAVEITQGGPEAEAKVEAEAPAPVAPKRRKRKRKRARKKPASRVASATAPAARKKPQALGRGSVMRTIRTNMGDVERCYHNTRGGEQAQGRIVMQWTLGQDGSPTSVAVLKNTLPSKSVANCLKGAAKRWRFPPPEGGVAVVTYPFNFFVQ